MVGKLASQIVPTCAPPSPRPDDRVRVGEHLAGGVEVAVAVVEERHVEERLAVVLEQQVVGEVERFPTLTRSARAATLVAACGS